MEVRAPGQQESRPSATRWPRLGFLAYLAVLVLLVGATAPVLIRTIQILDQQRAVFDPASAEVGNLLTGALNQETAARGYALTGDVSFLQPFLGGETQYDEAVSGLRQARLGSRFTSELDATTRAFDRWHESTDRVISDVSAGNITAARALATQSEGKALFNSFRTSQGTLAETVDQLLVADRDALHGDVELSLVVLAGGLVLGIVVAAGMWGWWRIRGRDAALAERGRADTAVLLQSVIDASTESIFAMDLGGRHILANRARHRALTDDPATSVLGRPVGDFMGPEEAARLRRGELEVVRTGIQRQDEEVYPRPDGPHTYLVTKDPLRDAMGRIVGVVGVARDVTLERALLADQQRLYRLEHELAQTMQLAMVGDASLDDDRVEVCARYTPALDQLAVGGDWYDVVSLTGGRIGLIVGDAVGHGIDSVTAMGQLRSALTALARTGLDPARTLEALDQFAQTVPGGHSATCVYAILDPRHQELTYASAGQMPPLVAAPGRRPLVLDDCQDPPLAATRAPGRRRTATVPFPEGSLLLLYTDGLIESRSEGLDQGLERLVDAVDRHRSMTVDDLADLLIASLQRADHHDDVALVGLRLLHTHSQHFRHRLPADAGALRDLRHAFDEWLAHHGIGEDRDLLVLAVGEAVANSIEHGYRSDGGGGIEVEAVTEEGGVRVVVQDQGRWRPGDPDPWRGRGFAIMRRVARSVEVTSDSQGTTVVLEWSPQLEGVPS
ncbi:MAG TPA: SpoIIE family protein phosphatase [Acidimicrobiales bacterium]|nr:SpoIIE family protein phosphatase [Acidimicrobiales bacterium]